LAARRSARLAGNPEFQLRTDPLIEPGAKWITGWEDVVEGLPTSLWSMEEARYVDDLVENSGLTSSEVRAALFDRELGGVITQLPGRQFLKVLL
jgi:predicted Rossmann fold nucleotide-binding protein DprA/Smf involved in DNA uptake